MSRDRDIWARIWRRCENINISIEKLLAKICQNHQVMTREKKSKTNKQQKKTTPSHSDSILSSVLNVSKWLQPEGNTSRFLISFQPQTQTSFKVKERWLPHTPSLVIMSWSKNSVDDLESISNSHHINVIYIRYPTLDAKSRYQSLTVHTTLPRRFNNNTSRCNLLQDKFILPKMPEIFYLLPNAWSNISKSHENAMNVKLI